MSAKGKGESRSFAANLSRSPSRRRLFGVFVVILITFSGLVVRLTQLQVVSKDRFETIGESQRIRSVNLSADRGSIFDRNGNDLAISVPQQTIWADPKKVGDPFQVASQLAAILNLNVSDVQSKLTTNARFVYIARKVDDGVASRVKDLKLNGIYEYEEPKRFLPGDPYMSSVIGQVGTDNEGLSGLEVQYDRQLSGHPGSMSVEEDPTGQDIPGGLHNEKPATRGDDLILTIDRDLQFKVESSLADEIQRANARGGIAAVMDTKSGEILALSNLQVAQGGFGSPVQAAPNSMALTNVYEPGSVSKLITISAALQTGTVSPATRFGVADQMKIYDSVFNDADPHPVESWTTTDILAASSNIGTITIAQKLGKDRLDQYQRAFGYGSTTGLHYPGESAGIITDPRHYSGTSLATTAIGQGVSVTAMQMVAAYDTIANGGVYVAPKLVKATIDGDGKQHSTPPAATHTVVSPQTAEQMNLMLQEVVRAGTATAAQVDGYQVAGKTGTARKPRPDGKGYQDGAYISTFAGFVPAAKPQLTAIVILDQPTPIYGGLVAAPVFSDIAGFALQRYGIGPEPADPDRHGVPFTDVSASSAASESDAPAGTTADAANAVTASANSAHTPPYSGKQSTSTSTSTSNGTGNGTGSDNPGNGTGPGRHATTSSTTTPTTDLNALLPRNPLSGNSSTPPSSHGGR